MIKNSKLVQKKFSELFIYFGFNKALGIWQKEYPTICINIVMAKEIRVTFFLQSNSVALLSNLLAKQKKIVFGTKKAFDQEITSVSVLFNDAMEFQEYFLRIMQFLNKYYKQNRKVYEAPKKERRY